MRRGAAQRRFRRPYRKITWQEMEQAFEVLFSNPPDSPDVAKIMQRFKESRRQVIPVFTQMIQATDPQEREVASYVLERLGQTAVRSLKKVVTDPDLSEVVRLEITALLEKLEGRRTGLPAEPGVEEPAEVREEVEEAGLLAELMDRPEQLLQGLEDETMLAEVLDRFADLTAEDQVRFVGALAATGDGRVLRLLLPLLSVEEEDLLTALLQALIKVPDEKALPYLHGLVEQTTRKRIRLLANRAIREIERVTARAGSEEKPKERQKRKARETLPLLPFHRAYATEIVGDGEQLLLVSREHPDQTLRVLLAVYSDRYGLLEIRGWEQLPRHDFQGIVREWRERGRVPVEVPLTYCREVLRETERHTRRRERPLPDDYEQWASMLESATAANHKTTAHLECADAVDHEALQLTSTLLDRPEFRTWRFPAEEIAPYLDGWHRAQRRTQEEERREEEESTITRFLAQRMTRRLTGLLRMRLVRQGWLLGRGGDEQAAQLAVTAATALLREHKVNPQQHPFLRALARKSFQELAAIDLPST